MMSSSRRTAPVMVVADPEPVMNITPLIDVLLVLIVMLILTIPVMSNELPIDLPTPGSRAVVPGAIHRIAILQSGMLTWDGAAIRSIDLPARLDTIATNPDARLQIESDARARYDVFDQTLAVIKRAGINRLGFVGNERFADFSAPVA